MIDRNGYFWLISKYKPDSLQQKYKKNYVLDRCQPFQKLSTCRIGFIL